jgi:hypothetical protein
MNILDKQIILDVYREHCLEQVKYLRHGGTIQEFINKVKTDKEFSEKWGLQIEERELRSAERIEYYGKHFMKETESKTFDELLKVNYDELNIPTKLITITYNDKTIESYE